MDAQHDEPATKGDLDQLKQQLVAKIDANSARIDANGKKIDSISATLNRLTSQVLDNRERMATKEEMNRRFDEILKGQDRMMVVLLRVDQERAATNARIDRVELDVEANKSEIKRIRTKLAMDT